MCEIAMAETSEYGAWQRRFANAPVPRSSTRRCSPDSTKYDEQARPGLGTAGLAPRTVNFNGHPWLTRWFAPLLARLVRSPHRALLVTVTPPAAAPGRREGTVKPAQMTPAPHEPPHPLAERLVASVGATAGALLDLGTGGGRNLRLLAAAHIAVGVDDDLERARRVESALRAEGLDVRVHGAPYTQLPLARARFAGALSTHALLHGTRSKIRLALSEIARVLRTGAPFFLTLASVEDERFGEGIMVEADVFAPASGDEEGVPHLYLDAAGVPELLAPHFVIESQRQTDVDELVGRWAHNPGAKPRGRRHWFVQARRR
ncbi:class I SAM-dependent methyltransferase [bacterium]|nr:MAG: class I SAM-dependent methyltransferase [bacterium]